MTPDVFTQLLRVEYMKAQEVVYAQKPADTSRFMTELKSTGREENYSFGNMVTRMREFTGNRDFQKFDVESYKIGNKTYSNGFLVNKEDVDDDKIGMYPQQAKQLVEQAKVFTSDLALQALCLKGTTGLCFDKSPFFSTTHNIGSVSGTIPGGEGGGNILNFTAAASDGNTFKLIFLMNSGAVGGIKPIVVQEREPLGALETNAGTPEGEEKREYRYWCQARWGVGYGFWWDALLVNITNTPTTLELLTISSKARQRLRAFRLPKSALTGDTADIARGPHDDKSFSTETCTLLCGGQLETGIETLLNAENIAVSGGGNQTNFFRGKAKMIYTPYLDPQ